MNNIYCVCTTPDVYPSYKHNWTKFPKEITWLTDVTNNDTFRLGFNYTQNDVRKNLNFNGEVSKKHYWNSQGNKNIIWFFAHLRMLNYYKTNPNYDYYWFFDDDVKVGDWNKFFENFDQDDTDFISYFIFKKNNVTSQEYVPIIDNKTFSKNSWFDRFPGDGDILEENTTELFGSFFPVVRFSNSAMKKLLEVHNKGLIGYSEGFVPTTLNKYNFKMKTLINSDNTSDFFDFNLVDIKHKNITIKWEWI
jgi:hypothetical protein